MHLRFKEKIKKQLPGHAEGFKESNFYLPILPSSAVMLMLPKFFYQVACSFFGFLEASLANISNTVRLEMIDC